AAYSTTSLGGRVASGGVEPDSRNGCYGILVGTAASVRLDVGGSDHLGPLFGFLSDELAEVGGRARDDRAAQIGKPRFEFGIGKARIDLFVEPIDDLEWRILGSPNAIQNT